MITQPTKNFLSHFLGLNLGIVILLAACSKPANLEPEAAVPAQYELTDIRYFLNATDRVDTIPVLLKGTSVQNPGNTLATQQVEIVDELVKTSQFEVDPLTTLPKGLELDKLGIKVPQNWYGTNIFDYFPEKFPLSLTPQQKPYEAPKKQVLTISIPPKSKIDVSRQIDAYQLTCSFKALLENKATGQRYTLTGKWKGLLRYNNESTTLKQYSLQ